MAVAAPPVPPLIVIPISGMTAAWLAQLTGLTQQVVILTAEKAGWATANTLQVSRPVYPGGGCRVYSGTSMQPVMDVLIAATAADLLAAQTALRNCMAGL